MLFEKVQQIIMELMDIPAKDITQETYLVRDLDLESIDFLELAVSLNAAFKIDIHDDTIFLRNLRLYLNEALEKTIQPKEFLGRKYPFLSAERIQQVLSDLEAGPVIKVKDLVSYVQWAGGKKKAA
ncbi:MAG: hypothetical protein GY874_11165 [Desulfobacteraceae bacterium]|nr:hypothetical protein [Desulfobacteraceae bacterium]